MVSNAIECAWEVIEIEQGSPEWLALRKTKITATDAPVIMGTNPWKTRLQLLHDKLNDEAPATPTDRMQRGIDLEPAARELFMIKTGFHVVPRVVVRGWMMASMDGLQDHGTVSVEIKCPGWSDHSLALDGIVPPHYIAQLQHQMYVCNLGWMFYFSFDGIDGEILEIERDDDYILRMIDEEWKFYQELERRRSQ